MQFHLRHGLQDFKTNKSDFLQISANLRKKQTKVMMFLSVPVAFPPLIDIVVDLILGSHRTQDHRTARVVRDHLVQPSWEREPR